MVGTLIAALQVECGQPPLALRRQRMMADYALKVKSTLEHPSASIIEDCWQSHYGNYPSDREPFGGKVKKTLKESEIDSVPLVPPIPAPWIKSSSASSWKYLLPYKTRIRDLPICGRTDGIIVILVSSLGTYTQWLISKRFARSTS